MLKVIKKLKKVFDDDYSLLREEAIETCKKNEIPLTEENILNVLEMIKFRKDREKVV
jgi:hypothetical protein